MAFEHVYCVVIKDKSETHIMHGDLLLNARKRAFNSRSGAGANKMLKLTSIVPKGPNSERIDRVLEAEESLINIFRR